MTPEDAYAILEAIAEMTGTQRCLKLWKASREEQADEDLAQTIDEEDRARQRSSFRFSMVGIQVGEEL